MLPDTPAGKSSVAKRLARCNRNFMLFSLDALIRYDILVKNKKPVLDRRHAIRRPGDRRLHPGRPAPSPGMGPGLLRSRGGPERFPGSTHTVHKDCVDDHPPAGLEAGPDRRHNLRKIFSASADKDPVGCRQILCAPGQYSLDVRVTPKRFMTTAHVSATAPNTSAETLRSCE